MGTMQSKGRGRGAMEPHKTMAEGERQRGDRISAESNGGEGEAA